MPNAIQRFADIQSNRTSFATSSKRISPALRHEREQVGCCVASAETELMEVQFWGQELAELVVHNLFQDFGKMPSLNERENMRQRFVQGLSTLFEKGGWHLIGAVGFGLVHSQEFAEHALVGLSEDAKWLPLGWF